MNKLPTLKPGDAVELLAPASACSYNVLNQIKELLTGWELRCVISKDIFGDDILCAHTDKGRLLAFQAAIQNPETQGIICVRGGYGSMRLLPEMKNFLPPSDLKFFMGMSDITALNLFILQNWQWPILHSAMSLGKFTQQSIERIKAILFKEKTQWEYLGVPLNVYAEKSLKLTSTITGGNLTMVQSSLGTPWQINCNNKILLLEEVHERGYRIDRMLQHLKQANILLGANAILLGDFIEGLEPDGSSRVDAVLKRFAQECEIPVFQIAGIGHSAENFPIPLGTSVELSLGSSIKLTF